MIAEDINLLIKRGKWNELVKIGEPAVEPLLASLSHIKFSSLRLALAALGDLRDQRANEVFVVFLESSNRFHYCLVKRD